jgi:ATP-dependent Clp protease adaptor protein ClpS
MPDFPDYDRDQDVITESDVRVEKPPMFKVLLHNDDFTTMEFVIYVLQTVFHKNDADAFTIMINVHRAGVGIAGVYTFEIAAMKADKCMNLAKEHEYPLLCTIEEE